MGINDYETRVRALEAEGMTRSDAQGIVDLEELKKPQYYQVRNNWQGHGYRLYFGDDRFVTQVYGEINGIVFPTVMGAKVYCLSKFGEQAVRVHD